MAEFKFNTIEEIQEFMDRLKKPRNAKDKGDDVGNSASGGNPPPPAMPGQQQQFNPQFNPQGGQQFNPQQQTAGQQGFPGPGSQGFAPPAAGAGQAGGASFAPVVPPEVATLVQRLSARIDNDLKTATEGQKANMLAWFRTSIGVGAEQLDFEGIKLALNRLIPARLEVMCQQAGC
jgi:hypothetical protein